MAQAAIIQIELPLDGAESIRNRTVLDELQSLGARPLRSNDPALTPFLVPASATAIVTEVLLQEDLRFHLGRGPTLPSKPIVEGKAPWLRFLSVEPTDGGLKVVLDIAGHPHWHVVRPEHWIAFRENVALGKARQALATLTEQAIAVGSSSATNTERMLLEAWGHHPNWLKIVQVKHGYFRDPVKPPQQGAEVTVRIRNKDYWFPSTPQALTQFKRLGAQKNRGEALLWFRRYVRRLRGYRGKWPDRTYVIRNRILKKNTKRIDRTRFESLGFTEAVSHVRDFHVDEVTTLPKGLVLYHGSQKSLADQIAASGVLRNDAAKVSAGMLYERGLIWLTDDFRIAGRFALGSEREPKHREPEGTVFEIELPNSVRLIDYYRRLLPDEADALNRMSLRGHYDPITQGMSLARALWKLYAHEKFKTPIGDVLRAIGYDGYRYAGRQFGIAADSLPIVAAHDVAENTKEEGLLDEGQVTDTFSEVGDQQFDGIELRHEIAAATGLLPEQAETVVEMATAGYPIEEIASALSAPLDVVRKVLEVLSEESEPCST